jgi:hypothetical protein
MAIIIIYSGPYYDLFLSRPFGLNMALGLGTLAFALASDLCLLPFDLTGNFV